MVVASVGSAPGELKNEFCFGAFSKSVARGCPSSVFCALTASGLLLEACFIPGMSMVVRNLPLASIWLSVLC